MRGSCRWSTTFQQSTLIAAQNSGKKSRPSLSIVIRAIQQSFPLNGGIRVPAVAGGRSPNRMRNTLSLRLFGHSARVRCEDTRLLELLEADYGHANGNHACPSSLNYFVDTLDGTSFIAREGRQKLTAYDDSEFLYLFEKDLTIELQRLRRDLYFVHSAVLEYDGKAVMLVAASGGAKSITTWALLHHGFRYLSDELGPVDLKALEVHPYPRALCLKNEPPRLYPLPQRTLRCPHTLHVPAESLPGKVRTEPAPLGAIFFLCYRGNASQPEVQPISTAEAGARLYANALNPLAHPGEGLDAALRIATATTCCTLFTADLRSTCDLVKATLGETGVTKRFRKNNHLK